MPNAFLSRDVVHAWSEQIGEDSASHQTALQRLLKDQRRLTRWLEENAESLQGGTGGVGIYLFGVVARMFDLAGGRLKAATWAQVREAEARVGKLAPSLLPLDDGLLERARALPRAQPHILDEALMALFLAQEVAPEQEQYAKTEAFKLYLLMWVATEVMDENWTPPKGFQGLSSYEYVHIEPKKRDAEAV
jgi:hypothetical protein